MTLERLTLVVRVTPKAAHNRIIGVMRDQNDVPVLKIATTCAPEKGKANKAVKEILAAALRVPKSSIEITSGEKARTKHIAIQSADASLAERIKGLLNSPNPTT